MTKEEINELVIHYLKKLGTNQDEDAYHALIEAPNDIVPLLIKAFREEKCSTIRSKLLEIIWQHRHFLCEAVLCKLNDLLIWANNLKVVSRIFAHLLLGILTI